MINRFTTLLDQIVPILVQKGVFYVSFGNEVDAWLSINPSEQENYLQWFTTAKKYAQAINSSLAIGLTLEFPSFVQYNAGNTLYAFVSSYVAAMDAVSVTYYPFAPQGNFEESNMSIVGIPGDFDTMVSSVQNKFILIQEIGFPGGYEPVPTDGSSEELQRQFVEAIFVQLAAHKSQIVFMSYYLMNDISPAYCLHLSQYYGFNNTNFVEYLCTLGLRRYGNGTAKPGFNQFITSLEAFRAGNLTSSSSVARILASPLFQWAYIAAFLCIMLHVKLSFHRFIIMMSL